MHTKCLDIKNTFSEDCIVQNYQHQRPMLNHYDHIWWPIHEMTLGQAVAVTTTITVRVNSTTTMHQQHQSPPCTSAMVSGKLWCRLGLFPNIQWWWWRVLALPAIRLTEWTCGFFYVNAGCVDSNVKTYNLCWN